MRRTGKAAAGRPRPVAAVPDVPPLTRRQREILDHLAARRAAGDPPPTLDELCRDLGLRSRGSLHKHVSALVAAGEILPPHGRRRGVHLARDPEPARGTLPLLGYIAAGRPIEAVDNAEPVQVPDRLRGKGPCYVLRVRGESMVDAGILDGDWVVVEARDHARDGEIVVALVDGSEATLKRIEQRPGACVLHAENPDLEPMVYAPERVAIQGVVVGQMRAYR